MATANLNQSLQRLIEIVPPPMSPVAPGSPGDWARVETELGVGLPSDFKEYIATYGAGKWASFFGIYDPFYVGKHPEMHASWRDWTQTRLGALDEFRKKIPESTAPFKMFRGSD